MEKSTAGKLYVTPRISLGAMEKDHVNRIPDEVLYVLIDKLALASFCYTCYLRYDSAFCNFATARTKEMFTAERI